jgi:Asp-tRNA(Asn)/Glu-tRNA(Gln) amidotransferase A subunit family amidase
MRWLAITYGVTMATPPACALPAGRDHKGLPFGIQVVGPNGADAFVLAVSAALERVLVQNPKTARPLPDISKLAKAKR